MYVSNVPRQPAPRASHRRFKPITAEVVEQEYRALTSEPTADAFKRAANRLNIWLAGQPKDEYSNVEPIGQSGSPTVQH